jgi:acyl carrier protein
MSPTLEHIADLVALQLGLERVDPNARLIEDLGATSIDLVAVLATIGERWGIELDETIFAEVETVAELARRVAAN